MNYGVHILKCPTGKYTYVGSIPSELMRFYAPPTTADVMGQRWVDIGGVTHSYKTRVFDTEQEARDYAAEQGIELNS